MSRRRTFGGLDHDEIHACGGDGFARLNSGERFLHLSVREWPSAADLLELDRLAADLLAYNLPHRRAIDPADYHAQHPADRDIPVFATARM
jgi:hypothetical protein